MRIFSSSTTEKCPAQSVRLCSASSILRMSDSGSSPESRKSTTPHSAGRPIPKAISPKSLSCVIIRRLSFWARERTSISLAPRITSLTETMSCPADLSSLTTKAGIFSLANIRTCCSFFREKVNPLRLKYLPSIGKTGLNIITFQVIVFL